MISKKSISFVIAALFMVFCGPNLWAETESGKISDVKVYSLNELYALAGKHAEKIKISEEDLYMAKLMREKAFSVLLPRVTAFGDHKYVKYDDRYSSLPPNALTNYDITQRTNTDSWGLRVDQSFTLNGKELTAFKMTKDSINKSKYDLAAVKEEYFFQVAAAYYTILSAKKAVEIGKANVRRLETHKNAVSIRLGLGEVTKTALYRTEAELSGARSDFVQAENGMRSAKAALAMLIDMPDDFSVQEPESGIADFTDVALNQIKNEALEKRSELKAMDLARKIAEDSIKLEKGAYWPTLALYGIYSESDTAGTDKNNPMDFEAGTDSYTLGITMNWTLFDNGLRKAEVNEARAEKRQAVLALKALSKQIGLEVEQAYLDMNTKKSIINSLKDQLAFANENYNAITKQFEHGLSNSVDVMDANTLLVTSERQLSEARYSYRLAVLKLERTKGTFLETVLSEK